MTWSASSWWRLSAGEAYAGQRTSDLVLRKCISPDNYFFIGGQKKLLELAAQSATFESAIVHEFFDNQNRSTPTKALDRRRIALRAESKPWHPVGAAQNPGGEFCAVPRFAKNREKMMVQPGVAWLGQWR
jgi:hypothetical protein